MLKTHRKMTLMKLNMLKTRRKITLMKPNMFKNRFYEVKYVKNTS